MLPSLPPEALRLLHGGSLASCIAVIAWEVVSLIKVLFPGGVPAVMEVRAKRRASDKAFDLAQTDPAAAVALLGIEREIADLSTILTALPPVTWPRNGAPGLRPGMTPPLLFMTMPLL
ncbi:hypothetical protein ABT278_35755 [Streptomyces sp. NPDC001228]|uniref:hypothetical protein n=1 Tax=Streptomyces sp. NPDC001228 TaxID=3154381 RepID=UPI0033171F86